MSRSRELLEAAAKTFDDLSDPFHHDWLVEHKVTLDECGDLAENVAMAIRVTLAIPTEELAMLIAEIER